MNNGNSVNNGTNHVTTTFPTLVQRKVALLGNRAVGKTSIVNSFVYGTFSDGYSPTIEATHHKTVRFRKVHFSCDIVDTAGQDEFSRLSRNASLGVHGYLLVFSTASKSSFDHIVHVNEGLISTLGDLPNVPRVLVGNMKDLQDHKGNVAIRQVSHVDANRLAESWNVPYIECSAKTGENVAEVFHTLLKEIEKDDFFAETDDSGCFVQ